jgi:hypothetical protein
MNEIKICPICKIGKSFDNYGTYFCKPRNKFRLNNYCNDCQGPEMSRRAKEFYQKNKEAKLQYARDYRKKNKEVVNKRRKHFKKGYVEVLKDCYVVEYLAKRWKVKAKDIRAIPGLIEASRANILLKRTIKKTRK